jgi:microcin C transport system permease protein
MPFILQGSIVALTSLDFLGFGLPPGSASLGEMLKQGKANLHAPWLVITAFAVIAVMLSLLIFIGEAVRDAFDPRKAVTGGVPPEETIVSPTAPPAMATVEPTAGPAATARRHLTKGGQPPESEP